MITSSGHTSTPPDQGDKNDPHGQRRYFKGIDLSEPAAAAAKLKIGTRVTTVFAPERKGEMLDFWFEITG
jgi:hypothetical protein